MANTLACVCSYHGGHFELYIPCDYVNLFSLYWMNFMFHTTLDTMGRPNIVIVHYKSMKCDVSCSHGSVSTLFRPGEHVFM